MNKITSVMLGACYAAPVCLFAIGTPAIAADLKTNDSFATREFLPEGKTSVKGKLKKTGGGDVDFFTFSNLKPGSNFLAEMVKGKFDTFLGWYDDSGNLLLSDDDDGDGLLSLLEGIVPSSGKLNFAVSAFPDFNFDGSHVVNGKNNKYKLAVTGQFVTSVPEPTGALGLGFLVCTALASLKRRGTASGVKP
jgi:hypothetical protein